MKKILHLSLSLVILLIVSFTIISASPKVKAAEAGTLVSNPIILQDGVSHTKYWTRNNYNLNCYNKIVVTEQGYIALTINKPYDAEGEIGSFYVTLHNEAGTAIWQTNTDAQVDSFSDAYKYKVGVAPGTYYMNLDPNFFLYSNSAPIPTTYKYDFVKDDYWEIESNNTQTNATVLELEHMYSGVFSEETFNTTYTDYFAVELTEGTKYTIKFDNYEVMDSTTTLIFDIFDPYGEEVYTDSEKTEGTVVSWNIEAETSGTYYLKLHNAALEEGVEYKIGVYLRKIPVKDLKVKLSKSSYSYDGKVKTPNVVATYDGEKLVKGTDYAVEYETGRKKVGKYTVTVTFKGNYTGTKTLTFKIVPKTLDKSKFTATQTTKSITLKWPKLSGATGYKIYQYNENTEKYKLVGTVQKNSFKKTGLKTGTVYKYKITAYKKFSDGTVLEGAQSKVFATATKCKAPQITEFYRYSWDDEYQIEFKEVSGAYGYEVYYSAKKSSGYKKAKLEYSASYDWNCFTPASNCKYAKVRAYIKVGGKKVYSDWSSVKTRTIY